MHRRRDGSLYRESIIARKIGKSVMLTSVLRYPHHFQCIDASSNYGVQIWQEPGTELQAMRRMLRNASPAKFMK